MTAAWDVLNIGNLSRNRFWGEPNDRALRPAWCTSTLIRDGGLTLVVDPGGTPAGMTELLDARAGLAPEAVDAVFVTHRHEDHRRGIDAFPGAQLWMAAAELDAWRQTAHMKEEQVVARFSPAPSRLSEHVELLPTNGHTSGHTSLRIDDEGEVVVVAGDAAMTRSFFAARETYFNSTEVPAARAAIDTIAAVADLVVPGHDNVFVNRFRHPHGRDRSR